MEPILKFIGIVHSELNSIDDCPLQENENAPDATISIYPEFSEGIQDIKPGSEILLLTWMHKADRNIIKCVPRRDYQASKIGVFSTRSPDRPNPIGIHKVKISSIDNDIIKVSALEVLDQTPIIDIKPVLS